MGGRSGHWRQPVRAARFPRHGVFAHRVRLKYADRVPIRRDVLAVVIAQVMDVLQSVRLRPEAQKELEARYRLHSKADFDKVAGIVRGCVTNLIH